MYVYQYSTDWFAEVTSDKLHFKSNNKINVGRKIIYFSQQNMK
jgi:hypothetical protein